MIEQSKVDSLIDELTSETHFVCFDREVWRATVQRWAQDLLLPSADRVQLPQNEAQAELMAKAGMMWLEQNAPQRLNRSQPNQSTDPEKGDSWEDNAKYLLERCPYAIRVREGGGPENLMSSLVVTFQKMQGMLEKQP